jgi:agmatinase
MALEQMQVAYSTLLNRPIVSKTAGKNTVLGKDGREHPRIVRSGLYAVDSLWCQVLNVVSVSLGGDHTIVLPILRSLDKVYGQPISVIHFGKLMP